jgi:hypothetical protein
MKKLSLVLTICLLFVLAGNCFSDSLFQKKTKIFAIQNSLAVDTTKPELSSVDADGDDWTFTYSEVVTATDDGDMCDGYTVTMSTAGALTFTYLSGTRGSDSVFHCTSSSAIVSGETITSGIDYTPGTIADIAASPNSMDALDDWTSDFTNSTSGGYATPAYVNSSDVYTGAYDTNTALSGATTGNFLALVVTGGVAQTVTGVTANAGTATLSAWTIIAAATTTTDSTAQIYVCWAAITGDGTVQVRPTGSASDAGYCVFEISGIDTTTPVVGAGMGYGGGSGSTSAPTDAVVTDIDNSFALAIWASEDADSTITWGNGGASPDYTAQINNTSHIHKVGYKVCSPTGSYTFSPTWTGTNKCETVLVVFAPAAL